MVGQTTIFQMLRVCLCLGFLGPAACLVGTGYIECDAAAAVTLIVIAVGLSGISMAGWGVNHLDLAPPYAGRIPAFKGVIESRHFFSVPETTISKRIIYYQFETNWRWCFRVIHIMQPSSTQCGLKLLLKEQDFGVSAEFLWEFEFFYCIMDIFVAWRYTHIFLL